MRHVKFNAAFTLVEVMVISPIIILVIGTFVAAMVYLTGDALRESGRVSLVNSIHSAMDKMENDVKMSGAFLAQNNITITVPQGYNNDAQSFTNIGLPEGNALILNTFVTNQNPALATRTLVNLANMPNACGSATFAQNQVMTMNTVYFIKDKTLWKRVLAANNYAGKTCSGTTIWQRPSCQPGITATMCATQDEALMKVNNSLTLDLKYFASPSDTTPVANATTGASSSTRQTALDSTRTVEITITAINTVSGHDIEQSSTLRVSRVGSLVTYATPN